MPAYLISYDLRKVRAYDALIKQLRDWGCISPLRSVWLGNLTGGSQAIRNVLYAHMDNDDGLMVVEIKPTTDWATIRVNENAGDWLRNNVGGV